MNLSAFCSETRLSEDAAFFLKPHWEKILGAWNGQPPDFVSLKFLKKYLPFLKTPDEEEILRRTGSVVSACAGNKIFALYMFAVHCCAFKLQLQTSSAPSSPVWGENEGIAALVAALSCAPLIEENCRGRGIPEHYAADALQWIGGTVSVYKLGHDNVPGFPLHMLYWLRHHLTGELYRIGRFEYLVHRPPEWMPLVFRNGDGVLAVPAAPGMKSNADGLVTLEDEAITSFIEEDGDFITGLSCSPDGSVRIKRNRTGNVAVNIRK